MLIIKRFAGQRFCIDTPVGRVWLKIRSVEADGLVKVAIDAPRAIVVTREEMLTEQRRVG